MKAWYLIATLILSLGVIAEENFYVDLGIRIDKTNVTCSWDSTQVCDLINNSNNGMINDCNTLTNITVNNCSIEYGYANLDWANSTYQYQHQNDIVTSITRNFPYNNESGCPPPTTNCNYSLEEFKLVCDASKAENVDYGRIQGMFDAKKIELDNKPCIDKAEEARVTCVDAKTTCEEKTCEADQTIPIIVLVALIMGFGATIFLIMRGE